MDKFSKNDLFELNETFFKIAKKMSPEQIKYYGRNEEKLAELLLNEKVTIIGKPIGSILIPKQEANTTKDIILNAPFKKNDMSLDIASRLHPKVPGSEQRTATSFPLHCRITHDEIIDQFGGIEMLDQVTFTLNQIKYLADQQHYANKKGLLVQGGKNHFLIDGRRNQKEFLTLYWYKPDSHGLRRERGSWGYYLSGNSVMQSDHGNLLSGRIFILE
ncbi:MAG: hypothetical protein JWL92_553 [Candidatus Nomurabacteria bacterium]|nr:hypothetical protein [Candidatus Nomurabacteria bacterium]